MHFEQNTVQIKYLQSPMKYNITLKLRNCKYNNKLFET